jgi:hypothetical protein
MNFGDVLGPVSNLDGALCDFWDTVGYFHSAKSFTHEAKIILENFRLNNRMQEKKNSKKN